MTRAPAYQDIKAKKGGRDDSPPGHGVGTTTPSEQKAPGGQTAEHRASTKAVAFPYRPLGHSVGDDDPEGQ